MTTKPPRLPDPCTPEQAAEWLTHWSDETWTSAAVLSQMFAVEAQPNETRIAYERGIVLVRIRPGTKLLRLKNGEWMPFETVDAMHLEAETGTALAYVFKGGEHYDATGGVIHLDPVDDSFIGQLASLGHATPRLLVDRDGTRYHVTEPVQASDIRLRKEWVKELLPGTVFLSEFDRLGIGIERGEHPDIASMLDQIQNTGTPPAANEMHAIQATESAGEKARQPDWEPLSPEQKKAAWDDMTSAGRKDKAPELIKKHNGNKTRAAAEVGISPQALRRYLKESEPEEPEAPLPVNRYTVGLGLVEPKRGKASR